MKMPKEEFIKYLKTLRIKHGDDVQIKSIWLPDGTPKAEYYVGEIHFATWWKFAPDTVVVWEVL